MTYVGPLDFLAGALTYAYQTDGGAWSAFASTTTHTLSDLADKQATVRVNFDLDRDEHTKLKIYAARTQQSITDVLRGLVRSLGD